STAVAAALARDAFATSVPHNLTNTTIHAAVQFAPGGVVSPVISPAVTSLTDGVLKAMLVTRLRLTLGAAVLACGLLGLGVGFAQQLRPTAASPNYPLDQPVAQPAPTYYVPYVNEATVPAPATVYLDPLTGSLFVQQEEPKKVAAKGIEDD